MSLKSTVQLILKFVLENSNKDYISLSEANQRILARDEEEKEVFRRLYSIFELQNMNWINLIIDTSFDSPETLALKVLEAFRS